VLFVSGTSHLVSDLCRCLRYLLAFGCYVALFYRDARINIISDVLALIAASNQLESIFFVGPNLAIVKASMRFYFWPSLIELLSLC
jgi:hypothetical protein